MSSVHSDMQVGHGLAHSAQAAISHLPSQPKPPPISNFATQKPKTKNQISNAISLLMPLNYFFL